MAQANAVEIEEFEANDLKDALVLLAFPTTGQASSIAAHYLVRHLELPLVGHIRAGELRMVASIQQGRATSAIRVFGGEVACKLDKVCPRIFLITTELMLSPSVATRLGEAVLAWAKRGGAQLVLAMEGVVRGEGDTTPDVFCAAADGDVLRELSRAGIPAMERALIAGIAARTLLAGPEVGMRTGAILVEASREHPDGRAAAALLEALGKIVPDVQMDFKPLLTEALELEAEIKRAQMAAHDVAPPPSDGSYI